MATQQRENAELIAYVYLINSRDLQFPHWQRVMPSPLSSKGIKKSSSQSIEITIHLTFNEHANPHYIPECTKPIHVPLTQLCAMDVLEERLQRTSYKWTNHSGNLL